MEKLHAEYKKYKKYARRALLRTVLGMRNEGLRFPFGNFMDYFDRPKVLIFTRPRRGVGVQVNQSTDQT